MHFGVVSEQGTDGDGGENLLLNNTTIIFNQ